MMKNLFVKYKKIYILLVFAVVLGVSITIALLGGSDEMTFDKFVDKYNQLSQKKFASENMDWGGIDIDAMEIMDMGNGSTAYGHSYQGTFSSPGYLIVQTDENNNVVRVSFMMNISFIASSDNFHNIVLDAMMQAYTPSLSGSDIYKIKEYFSMQDQLVGAVISGIAGTYEYGGKQYAVSQGDGTLNFSIFAEGIENYYDNMETGESTADETVETVDCSEGLGTWRQSSICYPGAADVSELGGTEIVIKEMTNTLITFSILDYSGPSEYTTTAYEVVDVELTESYGEYSAEFALSDGRYGTLTIRELTGNEMSVMLAIHSEDETYTRGSSFYNRISDEIEVKVEQTHDDEVSTEEVNVSDLVKKFQGYNGKWGDFGTDTYQTILKEAMNNGISLNDYFGENLNQIRLDISDFQWDGVCINGASCFITIEGKHSSTEEYVQILGAITIGDDGTLQVQIANN